mmetsp:Transcript_142421/g.442862  ORF Transcript_142421/g.442862 Transcript_142421/m.442862 type:complete len:251 (+) Transcript_142421:260-1012(+)
MLWEADVNHPVLTWPVSAKIDGEESFTVFAFPSAGAHKNCQIWEGMRSYINQAVMSLVWTTLVPAVATGAVLFGLAALMSGQGFKSALVKALLGSLVGGLAGGGYTAYKSYATYKGVIEYYYTGSTPSEVVALDADTGKQKWQHTFMVWDRPTAMGDQEGYKQKLVSQPFRAMCCPVAYSSPSVDGNGVVYIGHMSGNIYGVKDWDKNGRITEDEVYKFNAEGAFLHSGPAFAPGMFAFTTCDQLFVFRF